MFVTIIITIPGKIFYCIFEIYPLSYSARSWLLYEHDLAAGWLEKQEKAASLPLCSFWAEEKWTMESNELPTW